MQECFELFEAIEFVRVNNGNNNNNEKPRALNQEAKYKRQKMDNKMKNYCKCELTFQMTENKIELSGSFVF